MEFEAAPYAATPSIEYSENQCHSCIHTVGECDEHKYVCDVANIGEKSFEWFEGSCLRYDGRVALRVLSIMNLPAFMNVEALHPIVSNTGVEMMAWTRHTFV